MYTYYLSIYRSLYIYHLYLSIYISLYIYLSRLNLLKIIKTRSYLKGGKNDTWILGDVCRGERKVKV